MVIVLVGVVIIVKKPKTAQEYFEVGFTHYKKVVAAALAIPNYSELSPQKEEEYRKMVNSSTDSAIKSYQEIIDKYPESRWADDAQFFIAEAYFIRGDWDKAIEAFQKVIIDYPEAKLEPETMEEETLTLLRTIPNLHALTQRRIAGIYYDMKNDYPQAMIEFNKVIDKYPQDRRATLMAVFYIERYASKSKNYEPAISAYQKLLKIRVNKPKDIAFFEKKIKELQAKQAALKGVPTVRTTP